ncbi:hypothetical protein JCM11491_002335 [Sporobolomyces phaffii]
MPDPWGDRMQQLDEERGKARGTRSTRAKEDSHLHHRSVEKDEEDEEHIIIDMPTPGTQVIIDQHGKEHLLPSAFFFDPVTEQLFWREPADSATRHLCPVPLHPPITEPIPAYDPRKDRRRRDSNQHAAHGMPPHEAVHSSDDGEVSDHPSPLHRRPPPRDPYAKSRRSGASAAPINLDPRNKPHYRRPESGLHHDEHPHHNAHAPHPLHDPHYFHRGNPADDYRPLWPEQQTHYDFSDGYSDDDSGYVGRQPPPNTERPSQQRAQQPREGERRRRRQTPPPPTRNRPDDVPTKRVGRQLIWDYDTNRYYSFPRDIYFDVTRLKFRQRRPDEFEHSSQRDDLGTDEDRGIRGQRRGGRGGGDRSDDSSARRGFDPARGGGRRMSAVYRYRPINEEW